MLQQSFNNIGMFQQYYKYCVTILYLYVPTILQHSNNIVAALQCSSNFRVTLQCYSVYRYLYLNKVITICYLRINSCLHLHPRWDVGRKHQRSTLLLSDGKNKNAEVDFVISSQLIYFACDSHSTRFRNVTIILAGNINNQRDRYAFSL